MSYGVEFGRSRSNGVGVNKQGSQEKLGVLHDEALGTGVADWSPDNTFLTSVFRYNTISTGHWTYGHTDRIPISISLVRMHDMVHSSSKLIIINIRR